MIDLSSLFEYRLGDFYMKGSMIAAYIGLALRYNLQDFIPTGLFFLGNIPLIPV